MIKKKSFNRYKTPHTIHKHPFVVPVVTFIFLSFSTMFGVVALNGHTIGPDDSYVVQLSLDDKKQTVPTRASTVEDFLTRADVKLEEGDVVEPSADTPIDADNFRINVYRARPVTILDGDKRIQALSAATTARSIANQAGIKVYPEDELKQETSSDVLRDQVLGDKITINRATPANLNLYGTPVVIRTHAKTVRELLSEKNINLNNGDTVLPAEETPITPEIQVFVTRFGTQIVTSEEPIAMGIEIIEDSSLSFGARAVRQKGSTGKKLVTYQLELQNGVEVGRKLIQEVRTLEPVKEIIVRGKAFNVDKDKGTVMSLAGINVGVDYPYVDYIMRNESGWCPTKLQGHPGACPSDPPTYIPTNKGYGLGQATPGSKMAPFGIDWQTNPVTQLKWANSYAVGRYGSWKAAYDHWQSQISRIGHGNW